MGHYSESYERDEEEARKEDEKRLAALVKKIEERVAQRGLAYVLAEIIRGDIQKY